MNIMNGIFHPMLLKEENIFKQQGIRLEYIDGKISYNGVVYNEFARDIIFNIIMEKMNQINSKNYTSGGNTGGISNLALLISEVPIDKKDEIIKTYQDILHSFSQNGFGDIAAEIEDYINNLQNPYIYAKELGVFNGILYHSNPFYYLDITKTADILKKDNVIFDRVLKKYFTDNPYRKIIISGNGGSVLEDENINLSEAQIEQIKEETLKFQEWVQAPEDPEAVSKIPLLTISDAPDAPEYSAPVHEVDGDIEFYYTKKNESENPALSLYFPAAVERDDLGYLQLMLSFIKRRAADAGIENVYIDLACMEEFNDIEKIRPQISIYISGDNETVSDGLQKFLSFMQTDIWEEEAFADYIKNTPDEILKNGYRDPYYLSYELKQSSQSAGNAFYAFTRGSIGQGSVLYYNFLAEAKPEEYSDMLAKVKKMYNEMLLGSIPYVEYAGGEEYEEIKRIISEKYQGVKKGKSKNLILPIGYISAAVITNLEDTNHFMVSGYIADTDYTYSGKMDVIGSILTSKYILPVMRGRYGAYGANVRFDRNGLISAVAGLSDVDLAVDIWKGMGEYLRNTDITQKELEAMIIPIIQEYDEYYNDSDYGAVMALTRKTLEDIKRVRDEILSVTVEDLKSYADFIDEMVGQGRVFAVLGKNAADNAKFDFAYYADAETLKIYPQMTKEAISYIKGKTETDFCPDDILTRAEAAAMISAITADRREAEGICQFSDVNKDDWFYNNVVSLSEKGIINGYEDGSFKPSESITRAEFSSVLSKFIFGSENILTNIYLDLDKNDWFYNDMAKMISKGFISGYENNMLYPDKPVTRAEAVTIINKMLGKVYCAEMINPFTDVENHWAFEEIAAAVN